MDEYIERGRLKEAISADCQHLFSFDASFYDMVMIDIDEVPAADVAPVVHGRWIYDRNATDWGIGGYICSECKTRNNNLPCNRIKTVSLCSGAKFCPNCGAKMDLED